MKNFFISEITGSLGTFKKDSKKFARLGKEFRNALRGVRLKIGKKEIPLTKQSVDQNKGSLRKPFTSTAKRTGKGTMNHSGQQRSENFKNDDPQLVHWGNSFGNSVITCHFTKARGKDRLLQGKCSLSKCDTNKSVPPNFVDIGAGGVITKPEESFLAFRRIMEI